MYHSDNYNSASSANSQNTTFEIQTDISAAGCGGTLNKLNYVMKSPTYNGQYPNNAECIWEIRAETGYHIGLVFTGRLNIEKSDGCTKDYVEMFDYKNDDWISLGRVCGRDPQPPYNSTSERMKVVFRTDNSSTADGFTLEWQPNCGGIFKVDNIKRTLASPGFPKAYGSNMICNYTLIAEKKDEFVNVKFLDFDLEAVGTRCLYDNLTTYKVMDYMIPEQFEKTGTYCAQKSPGTLRYKDKAILVLTTDRWVEKKGFQIEYTLDSCGKSINSSQMITSPAEKVDGDYLGSLNCIWNITAPEDSKIVIRMETFSIEHSDQCFFDYVDIFSGRFLNDTNRLARLCGNLTYQIRPIVVKSNLAVIHLKTDQSNNFPGFTASIIFAKKCDLQIELTEADRSYELNALDTKWGTSSECVYTFTGIPMSSITIAFTEIHLNDCYSSLKNITPGLCNCDYVEILDGNGPFSNLIGKYCGHDIPQEVSG